MAKKKYFTQESLKTFVDEIKSYTDDAVSTKANSSHSHAISDVTNLQSTLDGKASSSHTHKYAGSSSVGGSATSAVKLDTATAGSTTQPVYFSDGKPVATTYKLEKSVPSNAVFTDTNTHYESKNVVGATNATSNTSTALTNGNVYLNSVENGAVTSSHKISGSGATTVTTDANGNIVISSTDNNTVYTHPTYTARTGKPTANQTPAFGGTATVSQITSDATGHVTGATDRTITIPSTLSNGTGTAGLIKTSSTVTSSSGYTACPVISGVPYYKDTNTTYSLSSFGVTATAAELNKMDGVTATTAELNYVDGVTSNIQTQLNGKSSTSHTHSLEGDSLTGVLPMSKGGTGWGGLADVEDGRMIRKWTTDAGEPYLYGVEKVPIANGGTNATTAADARTNLGAQATITGAATTITGSNLTASRALISNSSGKVAVSAVTSTELGYLDGVTSAIQTQLNGKSSTSHTHGLSGDTVTGILPMSKGGTGSSSLADAPANSIIKKLDSSDSTQLYYTATGNGAFYATSANGAAKFGTLPIAQGGTEATTAAGALTSLGALGCKATNFGYVASESALETQLNAVADDMVNGEVRYVTFIPSESGDESPWLSSYQYIGTVQKTAATFILKATGAQGNDGCSLQKVKLTSGWRPLEWQNPPLNDNMVYRTTERYMDKPVYAKCINVGSLTDGGKITHGLGHTAIVCSSGRGGTSPLTYKSFGESSAASSSNWYGAYTIDSTYIYIYAGSSMASRTGYITVWYTKDSLS